MKKLIIILIISGFLLLGFAFIQPEDIWDAYIGPRIETLWQKIQELFGKEIEKRRPIIEQEFEKEVEQIKQQIKQEMPSLWERFLELIK